LNIHRNDPQSGVKLARNRVKKCLDSLEESESFSGSINWNTEVAPGLSLEMMIMALVSAEQELD